MGEASVWYLYSKKAAQEIKAFNPDADIIIMLRNPVDMMYSLHSHKLFTGSEDIEDFEEALKAEEDRKRGLRLPDTKRDLLEGCFYKEVASYYEQVKRYLDIFGEDKVHIIIYEDFKNDTAEVYKKVLRFLGVCEDFLPDFRIVNPNKIVKSNLLRDFLLEPPHNSHGNHFQVFEKVLNNLNKRTYYA